MSHAVDRKLVVRLTGLHCMDCAAKFEQDLAAMPGVSRAELNFGAAKVTIEGQIDPAQVEALAKTYHIGVRPEQQAAAPPAPWWQANPHVIPTVLAAVAAGASMLTTGPFRILLSVLAILVGGYSTGKKGLQNLLQFRFDMNTLMTIAVTGACLIGEWGEAAVVSVLFGVSETLETYTMDRARQSIQSLVGLAPRVARVLRDGHETEVVVEDVLVGDTLVVRPGEKIAMDGVIHRGRSAINQATITGESLPVDRGPGDEVYAGTLNVDGSLEVRVTKLVEDSTLSRVIHMVEEAQAQRAPTQTIVERFARYYTPAIMLLAALVMLVPPLLLGQPWNRWVYEGLSLLVVGCPCALVVSTPVAIVSAISNAARCGVLIKGGAHLERAGSLKAIAFDKTGTLTRGEPQVTDVAVLATMTSVVGDNLLSLAAAVEARSEHPLAQAIVRRAGGNPAPAEEFQAIVGRGAKAVVGGELVYVGSPALFRDDLCLDLTAAEGRIERWQGEGKTVMLVGTAEQLYGLIAVADTPRAGVAQTLASLRAVGVGPMVMLTGDNAATAEAIGREVGVDQVRADLLPEAKVAAVRELVQQYGAAAMVGDGVNDAPALAAATVGIAMGGAGTDVALETADIALMADDLAKLPFTIRLSRQTLRVIKQNIGIALGLKLLAVLLVFPGWLTLWIAIMADMGASILVTLNGMRLLGVKDQSLSRS